MTIDEYAQALANGIEAVLADWVVRCVESRMGELSPADRAAAVAAGDDARVETGGAIRRLLSADIDEQASTPLTLLRAAVRYPTRVLREAGVPPVERDRFATAAFPADDYDLSPATWTDIDPALTDLGIAWGAAKAFAHKRRHAPPAG